MRIVPYPAEYKAWSNKNIRHFDVRVEFNGKTLTTRDIASIKIQSELMTEDTFAIGSSVTETLDFSFYIDTVFGANAFSNDSLINMDTPIVPYVSLCTIVDIKTDEGFIPTEVWQEVCMGIYYLNPDFMYVEGTNVMDIRASSMLGHGKYGDKIYEEDYYKNDENAMFSQPLISIITEICNDLGLTLSTTSGDFPNVTIEDKVIIKEDESEDDDTGTGDDNTGGDDTTGDTTTDLGCHGSSTSGGTPSVDTDGDGVADTTEKEIIRNCVVGKTYKEIIEYAALLYGGHARVVYKEVNGAKTKVLEFFKLELQDTPFYTYDESNCSLFKRGTEKLKINKFECAVDRDEVLTAGSDGVDGAKTIYLECQDMTQERLNAIFAEYSGYSYYPITAKIFGSPVLEVGDRILIKGPKSGTNREMPLQSITYNITGNGLTMDIQSKYAINKRKRETIKDAISDIDDQLDNLRDELDDLRDSTGGCFCDCEERLTALEARKECTCEPGEDNGSGEGLGGNPITFYNHPPTLYDGPVHVGTIGSDLNVDSTRGKLSITTEYGHDLYLSAQREVNSNLYDSYMIVASEDNDSTYYRGANLYTPYIHNTLQIMGSKEAEFSTVYQYRLGYGELAPILYGVSPAKKALQVTGDEALILGIGHGEGAASFLSCEIKNGLGEIKLYSDLDANHFQIKNADFSGVTIDTSSATDYEDMTKIIGASIEDCGFADCTISNSIIGPGGLSEGSINNSLFQNGYINNCGIDYGYLYETVLVNCTNSTTVPPLGEYTSFLVENGTNENVIYGGMNYYDGELRWCWKETVFTYPECDVDPETDEWIYTGRNICYIEIPIFMAENIQNDYHINICKMSWGDYRIIEKNPYYFILESQEEDFAFTFEVVAKLNDNQTTNNNAIIANEGYEVLAEVNED